jgi:Spy/CpxP family protein refolding chaperone
MMKSIKSLLLLSGLTLAMLISASAQEHAGRQGTSPKPRRAHMEQMITELDLSEEQAVQFKQVHVKHMEKMEVLRAEELTRNDFRAQAKMLRKEHDKALSEILTEEQYQQLLAKRKEMRAAHGGKGRKH